MSIHSVQSGIHIWSLLMVGTIVDEDFPKAHIPIANGALCIFSVNRIQLSWMPASLLTSSLSKRQLVDQGLKCLEDFGTGSRALETQGGYVRSTQPERFIFVTAFISMKKGVVNPLTTFRLYRAPWDINIWQALAFLQTQAPTCSCHSCRPGSPLLASSAVRALGATDFRDRRTH